MLRSFMALLGLCPELLFTAEDLCLPRMKQQTFRRLCVWAEPLLCGGSTHTELHV